METSESNNGFPEKRRLTADQIETARKKNGLLLARARVVQELEICQRDRYRDILTKALADLDAQLAQFG